MSIFLVLRHADGNSAYYKTGERIMHHDDSGVGGNGHDAHCHCLIISRTTYKTREEADAKAEELQAKHPNDFFFSLEVGSPE